MASCSAAPTNAAEEVSERSLLTSFGSSYLASASSLDKGAFDKAFSAAQGSGHYNHGAEGIRTFGTKESSGSKDSFSTASDNAWNQGAGQFSHAGGFNNAAQLVNFDKYLTQGGAFPGGFVPGTPPIPGFATGGEISDALKYPILDKHLWRF